MNRILKYYLEPEGITKITDPVVRVLSVGNQRNEIAAWALVDDYDVSYNRTLELVTIGTGWKMEEEWFQEWFFVGTIVTDSFVWHAWGRYIED